MGRTLAKLMNRHTAGMVDRERLFGRLDDEAERPVVWVQGPPGAGKTMLVASYLARQKRPTLWYRIDEGDIDLATAFSYLARGAAAMTRKKRRPLPTLTPEYLPDLAGFARRFFRHFFEALPPRAAVVLDAIENAPAAALQSVLLFALEELPMGQRLFVTSREAPGALLAHLQAKGELTVIGADELRLTADEAIAIAGRVATTHAGEVQRLHELACGWAAGFVVLLTHLRRTGHAEAGPSGLLAEQLFPYYLNELFSRADPAVQTLLMHTAVLPAFNAAQAAQLVPVANAEAVLDGLQRRHFFIECSAGPQRVYRYHPLFRDFLLQQEHQRLTEEQGRALRQQAAGLLLQDEEVEAALTLLIEAQAWPQAARLACKLAPRLLEQGRMATLENFLVALPAGASDVEHWLRFWRGLATLASTPQSARTHLERAYEAFTRQRERVGQMLACASILESYLYEWNDMRPVDRWADVLGGLLSESQSELPLDLEIRVLSSIAVLIFRGHRHGAMIDSACSRAIELLARLEHPLLRMAAADFVVLVKYLRGEWHAGRRFVAETEPTLPAPAAMPPHVSFWHAMKARLMVWDGDFEAAFATSALAERIAADHNVGTLAAVTASAGVFAGVNADDPARAEACLARMRAGVLPSRRLDVATVDLQSGLVALARGDARQARDDLRAAVDRALDFGADLLAAQFRIVLAIALIETDKLPAAAVELQLVLDYAGEAKLTLLEHGALMVRAWLAHRSGAIDDSIAQLRVALPMGREHGYRVIFPWVPIVLLQDVGLMALQHDIEPAYVRELIRLRRVPPPALRADAWPWRIRVFTLGRFELLIDDRPLQVAPKAPKKPLELLKALVALGGSHGVLLGRLGQDLWPDLDGAAAQNAFNVTLHRLRKLLGDERALVLHEGRLQLDVHRVWTDAESFKSLADRVVTEVSPPLAQQLLGMYRGHFLFDDEAPWAVEQRERLHSRFLRAAMVLVENLELAGQMEAALDLQRRVIEVDPLAEDFHRALMRCLHAMGRQAEALHAYQRCCELLARILGTKPSAKTEQLRQIIGM